MSVAKKLMLVVGIAFSLTSYAQTTKVVRLKWDLNAASEQVSRYYLFESIEGQQVWFGSVRTNGVYVKNGAYTDGLTDTITVTVQADVEHLFFIMAENPNGVSPFSNGCVIHASVLPNGNPTSPKNLRGQEVPQ